MICWSVSLAWAEADGHTLVDSIQDGTFIPGKRNSAEDDDGSAFVRYGGGGGGGGLSKPEQEDDRIIDGTVAEGDEFSFMAFVYYNQDELSDVSRPSCSATIIDRQWLLTAAHCLTSDNVYGPEVIYLNKNRHCSKTCGCNKRVGGNPEESYI